MVRSFVLPLAVCAALAAGTSACGGGSDSAAGDAPVTGSGDAVADSSSSDVASDVPGSDAASGGSDTVGDTTAAVDAATDAAPGTDMVADGVPSSDAVADAAPPIDVVKDAPGPVDAVVDDALSGDTAAAGDGSSVGDAPDATGAKDTGTYDGKPIALKDLAAAKLEILCTHMLACAALGEAGPMSIYASLAGCVALVGTESADLGPMVAAVAAGLSTYDPAKAGACYAAQTATCASVATPPPACLTMFKGSQTNGATCSIDETCSSGWCDLPESGCPGHCTAKIGAGNPCPYDWACALGLKCSFGKCVLDEPAAAGAPCLGGPDCAAGLWCAPDSGSSACAKQLAAGAACTTSIACIKGLTCKKDGFGKGVCSTPAAAGQPCPVPGMFGDPTACGIGLICVKGLNGNGNCAVKTTIGAACKEHSECGAMDLWCASAAPGKGTCQFLPTKGMACLPPDFTVGLVFGCMPPMSCTNGTCKAPPAKGEACATQSDLPCGPGLVCSVGTVCQPPPGVGQPCTEQCASGLTCEQGKCAALLCE